MQTHTPSKLFQFLIVAGKAFWITVAIFLVSDFVGFLAWAFSGQQPVDSVYLGTFTAHILRLFF